MMTKLVLACAADHILPANGTVAQAEQSSGVRVSLRVVIQGIILPAAMRLGGSIQDSLLVQVRCHTHAGEHHHDHGHDNDCGPRAGLDACRRRDTVTATGPNVLGHFIPAGRPDQSSRRRC